MPELEPITREEMLLDGQDLEPITRKEMFIKRIYDKTQVVPKPITREEMFLNKAGEGGGGDIIVEQLNVTENGTYSESGKAYSPVVVEVPVPTLTTLEVDDNGTYTAPSGTAYNEVEVDVPLPENAYLLNDLSGLPADIASFNDGTDLPMASLKVAVTPYQDLSHGDPSPSNICPIIGWDEAVVTVADDVDNPTVSHEYTIDLNGTRYGGTLDVLSGVLTVDRVILTVDENSNIISGSGGLPFRIDLLTGAKASSSASALTGVKCNFLKEVAQSSSWGVNGTFSRVTTDTKIVYFKVNSEITTIQQLKTFLQSNNLQFVYELATPITVQLAPTPVKSLEGTNNIFADCGQITEVKYFKKA